jgi:hypothetical protein
MRTYSVGTPMNTVASAIFCTASFGIELGHPDHLAAVDQCTVDRHKQAMHMEDGQRVDQHITATIRPASGRPTPVTP